MFRNENTYTLQQISLQVFDSTVPTAPIRYRQFNFVARKTALRQVVPDRQLHKIDRQSCRSESFRKDN